MKEKLLSTINSKIGETNQASKLRALSTRTVEEYATKVASGLEKDFELTDDFINTHLSNLEIMGGQILNEVATKAKSVEEEYQAKLEAFESKQNSSTKQKSQEMAEQGSANTPEEVLTFMQEMKEWKEAQQQEKEQKQKQAELEAKRQAIISSLKEKGADKALIVRDAVSQLDLTLDAPIEDHISKALSSYEKGFKDLYGAGFEVGQGGGSAEASMKELDDFAKEFNDK